MLKLVLRRLLEAIPLLLAVSAATFFLVLNSPGSYYDFLKQNPRVSEETIKQLEAKLGLEDPWPKVWGRYVYQVVRHGYFGQSFKYNRPVAGVLGEKLLNTFALALSSTLFAWLLAVPLGVAAAVRQHRAPDRIASFIAFVGLSVPAVLLALLALYFASRTGWFPVGGTTSPESYLYTSRWQRMTDLAYHLALPTIVLGMGGLAIYTRQTRSNLLEALNADYVRTARAKGVSGSATVIRHALRNAINPLITLFGFAFADLLAGAFLVENIMNWDGLGLATVQAYGDKDLFVIVGTTMMATVMLLAGNLLADLLLAWSDPRIRYD